MAADERIVTVKISELRRLKEYYPRAGIDENLVGEYVKMLKEGKEPPPISITYDNIIADGWHRTAAHERIGRTEIRALIVEKGDSLLLTAASLNSKQSKSMTDSEKRSVAIKVLNDNPNLSIEKIADDLCRSRSTVYEWTKDLRASRDFRKKQRVLELQRQGKPQEKIEAETGIPQRTISHWLSQNSSSGKMAKTGGTMSLSKYAALLKYQGRTEKQIASALGISSERVAQLLKEARAELDDRQRAAVAKMVNDDRFPASLAASLVRLGDEKKTGDVLNLWRAKEVSVHEATQMVEEALTEKVKEMSKGGKSQVEIGLKLGLSQQEVSYLLNKKINMFDAIAVAVGSGQEIEGTAMTQHSRERLVRAGVMRKDEFGYYILTDDFINKIVAAAINSPNSFLLLCLIRVMGFDKLKENEVEAKLAQLVTQIVKAKNIPSPLLTPAFGKLQNQNTKALR